LQDIGRELMLFQQGKLREKLRAQGHRLTGALEQSLQFVIKETGGGVLCTMYGADYSIFLEKGVAASNIPFTPGRRGNGGTSQYITGLIIFWQNRGLSGRDEIGAAFATATKHSREGMPTRASYRFSSDGTRLGFAATVLSETENEMTTIIETKYGYYLELTIGEAFGRLAGATVV
jgi:hypothetical protein